MKVLLRMIGTVIIATALICLLSGKPVGEIIWLQIGLVCLIEAFRLAKKNVKTQIEKQGRY